MFLQVHDCSIGFLAQDDKFYLCNWVRWLDSLLMIWAKKKISSHKVVFCARYMFSATVLGQSLQEIISAKFETDRSLLNIAWNKNKNFYFITTRIFLLFNRTCLHGKFYCEEYNSLFKATNLFKFMITRSSFPSFPYFRGFWIIYNKYHKPNKLSVFRETVIYRP